MNFSITKLTAFKFQNIRKIMNASVKVEQKFPRMIKLDGFFIVTILKKTRLVENNNYDRPSFGNRPSTGISQYLTFS